MPSARNATFTPAPVKPSDRAVFAPWTAESVPVRARPSGSSCGVAEHAPGGAFGAWPGTAVPFSAGAPAGGTPGLPAIGAGPSIGLSGITDDTPGLALIAPSAEAGTRAEMASTSR